MNLINKNFTLLWIGKIISQLGDKFYGIALAWWILQKTNSALSMGLFMFVSIFPSVILGFLAGALVDRCKRKNILVVTDILRGGLVLIVSCMAMNNTLEVWHVFAIAFCLSIATAFFDPAAQAILPEIVDKDDLTSANGLNQAVGGVCSIAGPLFGAIAVGIFGMGSVFMANSISYFISSLLAGFLVVNKEYRKQGESKRVWKDVCEGIEFLKGRKSITTVIKIVAAAHFFLGSLMVSLPFLAKGLSGDGIKNLGYIEMIMGVGLISGSIFMGARRKTVAFEQVLVSFMAIVGFCFGVISILQVMGVHAVYAYLAVMMVIGICIALASVTWQSLLQNYTPGHMTGRVFSISSLAGNVSLPASYCVFGMLLHLASIWMVMAGCCAGLIVLCYYLYVREIRKDMPVDRQEQMPGETSEE